MGKPKPTQKDWDNLSRALVRAVGASDEKRIREIFARNYDCGKRPIPKKVKVQQPELFK